MDTINGHVFLILYKVFYELKHLFAFLQHFIEFFSNLNNSLNLVAFKLKLGMAVWKKSFILLRNSATKKTQSARKLIFL